MVELMYPVVPYDVLGDIIDAFAEADIAEDFKGLRKLSTLSTFCRDQCRKHIFETIKVGNNLKEVLEQNDEDHQSEEEDDDWEDEEILDTNDLTPISRFISLITDHPAVAPHVRKLFLSHPGQSDQKALPNTLKHLTNISMLQIQLAGLEWTTLLSESLLTLSQKPSFNRLHIDDALFVPVNVLGSMCHLQHLQLLRVMLSADSACKVTTPPPQLKSFTVSTVDLEPFRQRRADGKHLFDLSGLTLFHFDVGSPFAVRDVSDFINHQSTRVDSVERLSFVIVSNVLVSGSEDNFNLEEHIDGWVLPNRRKLISLEVMSIIHDGITDPYSGLFTTLNKLESENVLTSLKVVVSISCILGDLESWSFGKEWKVLTTVLLKPGWKHLKSVWIIVMLNGITSEGVYKLNKMFKPLSSRPFETKVEVRM